jgi:hypothetical protein
MKLSPSIFWMIGGIFILIGVGLWAFQRYGPAPVPQPLDPEDDPFSVEARKFPTPKALTDESIIDPLEAEDAEEMVALMREALFPTATPDPFIYDGLTLKNATTTKMIFHLRNGGYGVPEFDVYQWIPGIFDTGIFDVGSGNVVSYEDQEGRIILLAHSGKNQTMTPIQNYLELSESGNRTIYQIADARISNLLIGIGEVYIAQGQDFQYSRIAAGVRVPPSDVEEVSLHIMDLVELLGERYPDSGFDKLGEDAIVLYFCGRALAGEKVRPLDTGSVRARAGASGGGR